MNQILSFPYPALGLLLLPTALLLDRIFGEPPAKWHPVCAMGRLAQAIEPFMRAALSCPVEAAASKDFSKVPTAPCSAFRERIAGTLAAMAVLLCSTLPVFIIGTILQYLHPLLGWGFACISAWLCMAPRSLGEHAMAVCRPLEAGQLDQARSALSMIVGRDVSLLDRHGVARACVESVAENLSDGVVATLFWSGVGLAFLGAPGSAAMAFLHRSANTLDAMWGKKDCRYRRFGSFAARSDDVLGFLPARLGFLVTALAAPLRKLSGKDALACGWRFRNAHESPNSAWTEASFAGALKLKLGGPAIYAGKEIPHPLIGEGTRQATPLHIRRAVSLMHAASLTAASLCALMLLILL